MCSTPPPSCIRGCSRYAPPRCRLALEVAHRGRTDWHPEQVAAQAGDAPLANPVRTAQDGAHRLHPGAVPPVLHRGIGYGVWRLVEAVFGLILLLIFVAFVVGGLMSVYGSK